MPPATLVAAIAGFAAMGVQSALVRIFYVGAPSTNVMTTATSQIAIDAADVWLARRYPHIRRTSRRRGAGSPRRCRMSPRSSSAQSLARSPYAALHWWSVAPAIVIVLACSAVRVLRYPPDG